LDPIYQEGDHIEMRYQAGALAVIATLFAASASGESVNVLIV
jgi:hypothetical protein